MKDAQSLFEAVKEIVYDVTGVKTVTLDTDLVKDLSLNSFDVANMLNSVEEKFGVQIPIRDVWELNQVKDIIDYLAKRGDIA